VFYNKCKKQHFDISSPCGQRNNINKLLFSNVTYNHVLYRPVLHAHDQTYPCTHTAPKHHKTHTKKHIFTHLFFINILLQFSDTDLLKHKLLYRV
jgi:hypothetical protein